MDLPNLYSRRKRSKEPKGQDIYHYDVVPERVRVQIVQILRDAIGPYYDPRLPGMDAPGAQVYEFIVKTMRREIGVHCLSAYPRNAEEELFTWMQSEQDIDYFLDAIELSMGLLEKHISANWDNFAQNAESRPDEAIREINARLLEASIGYQFASGEIVRVDSLLLHREVVIPALKLLNNGAFQSAESEYIQAHDAYRRGEYEDCIVDCCKSLESVLKVIAKKRGWNTKETDSASKLIQAGADSGFFAGHIQGSLNHLKGLMESSTPAVRNKMGGHGAGTEIRMVPQHLASFQIYQTGAVLVYLVEQDNWLPMPT